jgi:type I restriction enzyme R subunit
MSPQDYTEDHLVEQPALEILTALGWQTINARDEVLGPEGTLGRDNKAEVVLWTQLIGALQRLNQTVPPESLQVAAELLQRHRGGMDTIAANREIYGLMKDGIPVTYTDARTGAKVSERVRVIDWQQPTNNTFLAVSQLTVTSQMYTCRPDVVCFVNGLPWLVLEFKKPQVSVRAAFDENITHYKAAIPQLFWYNVAILVSNGTASRVGTISANWERFVEWKRIADEKEPRRVSLEVMLRGICDQARLVDICENFVLFSTAAAGTVKIMAQNHQYLGVNNALRSMITARSMGHGRAGVFWQTQGSGKSLAMVFFAQKVLRTVPGNWTFVVVTDRIELDDQIAKTFASVGALTPGSQQSHATSGAHLRQLLRGNERYVFTLIHKFQTSEVLTDRSDVIVMADEAHRSQYDTMAMNMRAALPRAMFLAFTGTPLIAGEERTREVFGDYVSIYDFKQSIEDGATVPLYYENRTPELKINNPNFDDEMQKIIDAAELDDEQEAKLNHDLGRQYHILTRDDRLETIARDIVQHFIGRGFVGKAMVVSIDKATAVRMYDKVKTHWQIALEDARDERGRWMFLPLDERDSSYAERLAELDHRYEILQTTDMAVVVSPGQNEITQMQAMGLDIEPHRRRMKESTPPLDEKFKDTKDPLRIVFVCAMWLTGFDAPSCSTIYLDKPMRNHTLMQTIARANRVYPGKHSGIIVDYANVFAALERALALYGATSDGVTPIKNMESLVSELRSAVGEMHDFCSQHNANPSFIHKQTGLARLEAIQDAVEGLINPEDVRRRFMGHVRLATTLYQAVKPDPVAQQFAVPITVALTVRDAIQTALNPDPIDTSDVMKSIALLLDRSLSGVAVYESTRPPLDLSRINFQALADRFKQSPHKQLDIEALKASIQRQIEKMVTENPARSDLLERFKALIDSYNNGSRNIEDLFGDLVKLAEQLSEEQQRHVRENLSESELVIFDILTRPAPALTTQERDQVKRVARELLARLQETLVLEWRQRVSTRARVQLKIQEVLDTELPAPYDPALFNEKCQAIYAHIAEKYAA